jgi:pimeloyl-ACP methyl ester carboxylesterase
LVIQSTYVNPERVRILLKPRETSPWLELIRQHLPTAKIEIVSGVGHFPMLEAPEAVNQAMASFVANVSR